MNQQQSCLQKRTMSSLRVSLHTQLMKLSHSTAACLGLSKFTGDRLFMTLRILEKSLASWTSPGYFDRHGYNQLWQRIFVVDYGKLEFTSLIGMQFRFLTLSCWISNFQCPPQPRLGHPPQSLPSPHSQARIPSRSVTSPTTLASISSSFPRSRRLLQRRYSKGYDLMDPEYLEIYHLKPYQLV